MISPTSREEFVFPKFFIAMHDSGELKDKWKHKSVESLIYLVNYEEKMSSEDQEFRIDC